jgi:hypothetical protein
MSSELSHLAELGDQLYDAEAEVLRLEAELKRAKKHRDYIQNELVPNAMEEIGILEFRTSTSKIEIREKLVVQPKVENRPLVLQELERYGAGSLIKTRLEIPFNRGEDDAVAQICASLHEAGRQYKQERKVEPSTLKKFVKDRLEEGKAVNMDLFGVRRFKQAIFEDGAPEAPAFDDE